MKIVRLIALLEGLSLLILVLIAMPMKYFFDSPLLVKVVGMAHGLLFIIYIVAIVMAKFEYNWKWKDFAIGFIGSVLPFGFVYVDRKVFLKY